MTPAPNSPFAALIADAIARIEERRDALDRLADKGIAMVERLVAGEDVQLADRKPFADPARAYAVLSRGIRICLALASRLDEELIALLRGGPIPDLAILAPGRPVAPSAPQPAPVAVAEPEPVTSATLSPKARIVRAMDAAIEVEAEDREAGERMRAWVGEHVNEGEDYDALLHKPWRAVVQAICLDLGLRPDWTALENGGGLQFEEDNPPTDEPGTNDPPTAEPETRLALTSQPDPAGGTPDPVPKRQ